MRPSGSSLAETNELGHETFYEHEPGTGARLATLGPNRAGCAVGVSSVCPPGTRGLEEDRVRVDGLGRTIERFETFSEDGQIYTPRKVEIVTYVDQRPGGTTPTSVTRQTAIDTDAGGTIRYRQAKTELDGHGRPIRERVYISAVADQVTTFGYRNDGILREVTMPDPSSTTDGAVSYLYDFDSIGRATEIIRPDALDVKDRSRVRIDYDGLSRTTREVVGVAGGLAASTTTVSDRYDRLVRVDEELGPMSWASTSYAYGADDLVATIVDPEGVTTHLRHDLGQRRTEIERAGRTWRYGYDKNDNMVSQRVPGAESVLAAEAFTSTTAYDALDRPSSQMIGQRDLSAADQALFATGTEVYSWDRGAGHVGYLSFWSTFAPGSATPAIRIELDYNAQGQRTRTEHTLNLAGYANLSRQLSRDYHLSGAVRRTDYHDEIGGMNATSSVIMQDARGLPESVILALTGQPDHVIAAQTRNVAGLVTKRRTDVTTTIGYIESNWLYDRLGRVRSQVVQRGPGSTQIVRQALEYFGNDNPRKMEHWLGTANRKQFEYTYDQRHQLKNVVETAGGAFSATYDFDDAGRLTHAIEAALALPGSDVKPRSVRYQYAGVDPDRISALMKADGTTFASYEYDAAGNRTYQCQGVIRTATTGRAGSRVPAVCVGESLEMVYDGKDQLRRVSKKVNGSDRGGEEFWYNGFNQRIATVKRDKNARTTGMIWWLDDTEAHYDASGALMQVYSHLSLGTPVARVTRTTDASVSVELQFHDGLANNTLAAVDGNTGATNAAFVYAPFGELVESVDAGGTVGAGAHRRRMNDKFVDEVSALAYYGFRYYDKLSMTWTQSDPLYRFVPDLAKLGSSRRANLYTFSLQNPLRYLDPDGRDSTTCTQDGKCTTAESTSEEAIENSERSTSADTPTPTPAPAEKQMGTGQKIAIVVAVSLVCAKCGIVLGAGLFSGGDEASSLMAAAPGGCMASKASRGCGGARDAAKGLPDDALVCRGGTCTADRFVNGSGVTVDSAGKLQGVSVQSGPGATLEQLTATVPNKQVGVTSVGNVRAAGGDVIPSARPGNPLHSTMSGITPQRAEELFTPTVQNPSLR